MRLETSLFSHLEVAPRRVPLPAVEQIGRPHVVPGDVSRLQLDLRDHVLKETDEHHDLHAPAKHGGGQKSRADKRGGAKARVREAGTT